MHRHWSRHQRSLECYLSITAQVATPNALTSRGLSLVPLVRSPEVATYGSISIPTNPSKKGVYSPVSDLASTDILFVGMEVSFHGTTACDRVVTYGDAIHPRRDTSTVP